MRKRIWKRVQPTSISHAMELCIEFAKERHNRSVDTIADLMGLSNKWTLYKWVESGKIPAVMIRAFEHACGVNFVTRWIAHSGHQLLIPIPTGRAATAKDINGLNAEVTNAVGALIKFYDGALRVDDALAAIANAMTEMAWHRENVLKSAQPELAFNAGDDDGEL